MPFLIQTLFLEGYLKLNEINELMSLWPKQIKTKWHWCDLFCSQLCTFVLMISEIMLMLVMITAIKLWSRVLFKIFQIGSIFPSSQWQPGHICVEITKQPCTSNCVERNTKYSKNILRNHSFFHAFQCKICLHDALLVYQKDKKFIKVQFNQSTSIHKCCLFWMH